jgi:hypothetical protein
MTMPAPSAPAVKPTGVTTSATNMSMPSGMPRAPAI